MVQASPHLKKSIKTLAENGLNLFSVLAPAEFPVEIQDKLKNAGLEITPQCRIILIGHAGAQLWRVLKRLNYLNSRHTDPIDIFSTEQSQLFANLVLGKGNYRILYPGKMPIPLQQLGALAGWHKPSPFGVGINQTWGTWFAYRSAIITDVPLKVVKSDFGPSPCDRCIEKPCISACPPNALGKSDSKSFETCASFRLLIDSTCADRCHARLICPVASEHRYSDEQVHYHYTQSLKTLITYYDNR